MPTAAESHCCNTVQNRTNTFTDGQRKDIVTVAPDSVNDVDEPESIEASTEYNAQTWE
jgi:hypothetical protein